ncbi:MAG: DUF1549 and DUF1553 domain-containing protein, partial [Verrucomicrobiota bacterium]
ESPMPNDSVLPSQKGLKPVGDTDRYTLLRRVTFDLTGLPPTVSEIEGFVRDPEPTPKALEKAVDRLLDSDAFGERWARHWLDIARYAESNGSSRDYIYHHAWRFRDYVIDAFNNDKPYDEFVREQIAGDLMSGDTPEQRDERRIATGFMTLSSKDLVTNRSKEEFVALNVGAEQIDVMTRAFMASTIGCAQCHYHKFDPISDDDFYALYGMFRSSRTLAGISGRGGQDTNTLDLIPLEEEPSEAQKQLSADLQAAINEHGPPLSTGTAKGLPDRGSNQLAKAEEAHAKTIEDLALIGLTVPERYHQLENFVPFGRQPKKKPQQYDLDPKMSWILGAPLAMGLEDRDEPADVPLFIGGESDKPGRIVPRGFPKVMDYAGAKPFATEGSGRLELAEWMSHPNHPLTARVMVNRVWSHLFGRGIVESVDNFGVTGARPTHPEMLDFLAIQFTQDKWSVKRLIRRMVLSRAYRQKSEELPAAADIDPENHLLWKMSPKRLEVEAIRDSMIAVSGALEPRPATSPLAMVRTIGSQGGETILSKHGFEFHEFFSRTVYTPIVRRDIPVLLDLFDFPDPNNLIGNRDETTTPTQALYLMNNPLVDDLSARAASVLTSSSGLDTNLQQIYLACFGRLPDADDQRMAESYLNTLKSELDVADDVAWAIFIKQLFSSAEFRYLY